MLAFGLFAWSFLFASPAPPDTNSAKAERERWQGTWRITQMDITTGKRSARLKFEEAESAAWRVDGDDVELMGLNFPFTKARLSLDLAKDPKRITLTLVDGSKKGDKIEGTYTRDGDRIDVEFPDWPKDKNESAKLKFRLKKQ